MLKIAQHFPKHSTLLIFLHETQLGAKIVLLIAKVDEPGAFAHLSLVITNSDGWIYSLESVYYFYSKALNAFLINQDMSSSVKNRLRVGTFKYYMELLFWCKFLKQTLLFPSASVDIP